MPEEARAELAHDIAEALRDVQRPSDGQALVEEVWTREQAFAGIGRRHAAGGAGEEAKAQPRFQPPHRVAQR